MSLANKGSRRITVDGRSYRWIVSPDSGYMVLVVELAEEPGQRLEAVFQYDDRVELVATDGSHLKQQCSISPGVVRLVIQAAISRGWQPSTRGLKPIRLHDPRSLISDAID